MSINGKYVFLYELLNSSAIADHREVNKFVDRQKIRVISKCFRWRSLRAGQPTACTGKQSIARQTTGQYTSAYTAQLSSPCRCVYSPNESTIVLIRSELLRLYLKKKWGMRNGSHYQFMSIKSSSYLERLLLSSPESP